ncbi:MAG: SusC/RagA family TonB-linked outer membrane protein [Bacteroidetes bacterium]|nr:SusC/RagA family TonB-linked outer membrane protein [Bacteroidota bacterium]
MKKLFTKSLLLILLLLSATAFSQRAISGTVTDAKTGEKLIGVIVGIKGTTIGTNTDASGNYTLTTTATSKTLVFSLLGMRTKEVDLGAENVINVALDEDLKDLDEVVVTANAIKREKRSLGYATTQVTAKELTTTTDRSALNLLSGKVAGLTIVNNSGSPGSSTRVTLRSPVNITGDNQALIVIDGIPINNSSSQNSDNLNYQVDAGNRVNDINPDDIESINVLEGPQAAALYGSRASNGVIVITTKKGVSRANGGSGKNTIRYSAGYTWEDILKLPDYQNEFGQGGEMAPDSRENFSWGPKFVKDTSGNYPLTPWGQAITDANGVSTQRVKPYAPLPNNVKDFFDLGHTLTNNIGISGGTANTGYNLSFSNLKNNGVIPGTDYKRNTFTVTSSSEFANNFYSDMTLMYAQSQSNLSTQGQGYSVYDQVLQTPRDIPLKELEDLTNKFNSLDNYYGAYTLNPYQVLTSSGTSSKIDNFIAAFTVGYKATSWMDIKLRLGTNFVLDSRKFHEPVTSVLSGQNSGNTDANNKGLYSEALTNNTEINSDLIIGMHKDINKDFKIMGDIGHNVNQRSAQFSSVSTAGGLVIPEFYSTSNSKDTKDASTSSSMRRLYAIWADATVSYKNYAFLTVTGRNDHSSTLSSESRSFFYPSVNLSCVFTDALKIDKKILNYGKVRVAFAKVGKDPLPYRLATTYSAYSVGDGYKDSRVDFPVNSVAGFTRGNRIGNPTLTPEFTTSTEIGTELSFLKNRIFADFSYSTGKTTNLILDAAIAPSSGYTAYTTNAGELKFNGYGMKLRGTPVQTKDITWNITVLYSKYKTTVTSLNEGATQVSFGGLSSASVVAAVGQPFGSFYVIGTKTENGKVVVDSSTGLPVVNTEPSLMGSYQPDWTGSMINTVTYKGFTLNVNFEHRQGGMFYSRTKDIMEFVGTSVNTLDHNREDYVIPNTVYLSGDGTYHNNTTQMVHPQDLWTDQKNFGTSMLDATFTKLRELSISYQIPAKWLSKTPLGNASVGFSGRNLWMKTHKDNTFVDPETSSFGTGNDQGFEFGTLPSLRSYGFNLNVTF